jgi:hypothetical protein
MHNLCRCAAGATGFPYDDLTEVLGRIPLTVLTVARRPDLVINLIGGANRRFNVVDNVPGNPGQHLKEQMEWFAAAGERVGGASLGTPGNKVIVSVISTLIPSVLPNESKTK